MKILIIRRLHYNLSKAFDFPDHQTLLCKEEYYSIRRVALSLIQIRLETFTFTDRLETLRKIFSEIINQLPS